MVCILGTLIRPLFVSTALLYSGSISSDLFFVRLATFWLSDALACILLVPMVLIWSNSSRTPQVKKYISLGILFLSCLFMGQIVFFSWFQSALGVIGRSYWMFLFVSLIAINGGVRLTSVLLFILSIQAFCGTISGYGPFGVDAEKTGMSKATYPTISLLKPFNDLY